MTVVINEFEVVPEAAPAETVPAAAEAPPPALPAPEVERVLLHLAERASRIEAH